jgi:hypothetical protein
MTAPVGTKRDAPAPANAVAVIVPAEKLPLASRATIALAVLVLVAVVALLATFPAVEMVASEESGREDMAVLREMAVDPSKLTPVAVTAPVREMARGV